jgi:hypothetical protein
MMKKIVALSMFSLVWFGTKAQETMQQVMEKRAKEMHRVICLSDKEQWKKFIKENYSQALIERPLRAKVSKNSDAGPAAEKNEIGNSLEGKVSMFQRLHDDFGGTKITSIKTKEDKLEMVLGGADLNGTFNLKFNSAKPYLIEDARVLAEAGSHP